MKFKHNCCLLAAALLNLSCVLSLQDVVEQIKTLCVDPASDDIDFKDIESAKELLNEYNAVQPDCLQTYSSSFEALSSILFDQQVMNDICGQYAYDRIRDFHTRFISIYVPEMNKEELSNRTKSGEWMLSSTKAALDKKPYEPIPTALRKFFIIFVRKINASCKKNLVERLMDLDRKNIVENDYNEMKRARDDSANILIDTSLRKKALSMPSKETFYDLELFDHSKYRAIDPRDNKLYIQVKFNSRLIHIQDLCLNKFKPIYDELFAPVIRLNNLAYIQHDQTGFEDTILENEPNFTRWYSIIEICELFKDVEVLQDSSSLSAVADLLRDVAPAGAHQTTSIRIWTREEADKIKARIEQDSEAQGVIIAFEPGKSKVEHERVSSTALLWVADFKKEGNKEVSEFERQIRKLVAKKGSPVNSAMTYSKVWLKYVFKRNKINFLGKNEDTSAGKFALFLERHGAKIRLLAITVCCISIGLHFG